jgi:hypothetical protein
MKSLSTLLEVGSLIVASISGISGYFVARALKKRAEMYEKKYREHLERQLRVRAALKR